MIRIASTFFVAIIASSAHGAPMEMICENPRREYRISFDPSSETFYADETLYRVLAVEKTGEKYIVVGLTVEKGPTFRAHFRPY